MRPVAVVTGATGGIGKEIVGLLIADGYQVHALTRRPEELHTELPGHGDLLVPLSCDLMLPDALQQAADTLVEQGRPIQALIHCAGSIHPEAAGSIRKEHLETQMMINLTAPMLLTSKLVPLMHKGSHIVFVNSMAGILPLRGNSVYTATKFGLRGFARSVSLDLQSRGVRISSIFPGAVDTPMLMKEMEDGGSALNFVSTPIPAHDLAKLIVRTCTGRGGEFFRPRIDGAFSHACLMMPWLLRLTLPILQMVGTQGQRRFLARRSKNI